MLDNRSFIVEECLKELGLLALAKEAATTQNGEILNGYVKVIEEQAAKQNRNDILERLIFGGFIYG